MKKKLITRSRVSIAYRRLQKQAEIDNKLRNEIDFIKKTLLYVSIVQA